MTYKANQGKEIIVSPCDAHLLAKPWTATNNPNARSLQDCWYCHRKETVGGRRRTVYLHRLIMNPPAGFDVDHLNGNGLDNRRENLEIVTRAENVRRAKARQWGESMKDKIVKIILDERTTLDNLPGVFDGESIRITMTDGTAWYTIYFTATELIDMLIGIRKRKNGR